MAIACQPLGSNAKDISSSEVYDAINNFYKSQFKFMHQLGKGI